MKTWQVFLVGTIATVALFSLPAYESSLAGIVALTMLLTVVVGFCLRPRKEVFYLRTTVRVSDPSDAVAIEHDKIAVRIELTRLWLLFLPTFAAVAFLLITYANGTTWKISLIDSSLENWPHLGPYPVLLFFRVLVIGVIGLLAEWISERWVMRDASACSARFVHGSGTGIMYSFQDPNGEYYGGHGVPLDSTRFPELRTIVFYRTGKPDLNRIAMCCLFHRVVLIGRGLTDLDEITAAAHSVKAQPASQAI
jgi:hypothetical protein